MSTRRWSFENSPAIRMIDVIEVTGLSLIVAGLALICAVPVAQILGLA